MFKINKFKSYLLLSIALISLSACAELFIDRDKIEQEEKNQKIYADFIELENMSIDSRKKTYKINGKILNYDETVALFLKKINTNLNLM